MEPQEAWDKALRELDAVSGPACPSSPGPDFPSFLP
jgi:hypothetical protein